MRQQPRRRLEAMGIRTESNIHLNIFEKFISHEFFFYSHPYSAAFPNPILLIHHQTPAIIFQLIQTQKAHHPTPQKQLWMNLRSENL